MADSPEPIHPGSFVGDTVEEFKKLPTWGKIGVGAAAVAVVGIAIYMRSRAGSSKSGVSAGINTGAGLPTSGTDLSGGSAAGPTNTPTSGGSGTQPPPSNPLDVFANLLSGTNGNGLLGHGATVYSADGKIYATQPGGIRALLSSILPNGTRVYEGGQGRWWYQLPGEHTQYLLTSGAGNEVVGSAIGQNGPAPSSSLIIGSTTSNPQNLVQNYIPHAPGIK